MRYEIRYKPRAVKDLKALSARVRAAVLAGIRILSDDLKGDVKRLTNFTPEYRLRVGKYRVLFEIEGNCIIVYRVLHRRESYR